ncbi:MAG: PEGA domain-containing protein [Phycisphaerales bacterium]|nr:PEGA domain-containing protein [Phycisphaerales bacterium]
MHRPYSARLLPPLLAVAVLPLLAGCVRRTITVTSNPDGALIFLNEREVGRTPLEVEFTYYGTYDVRVVKEGYETLVTSSDAKPPVWDTIPLDLFSELAPGTHEARVAWHYDLVPRVGDEAGLLERARSARATTEAENFEEGPSEESAAASDGEADAEAGAETNPPAPGPS